MKVTLVVLAVLVGAVLADESNTDCNAVMNGGSKNPQMAGKKCGQVSKNDCKFIHDAIACCKSDCGNGGGQQTACQGKLTRRGRCRRRRGCFHGADIVQTKEYGNMTIHELSKHRDGRVLTRNDDGQLDYTPVRYWLHAQPTTSMKFLILHTESGHRLSITADHLIYQTECRGGPGRAIFAKNVEIGRCLYINENGDLKETRVLAKDRKKMTGIYSPITETGSIVVNDVLASCYSYYENESLNKFIYQYVIGFQDVLADWLPTPVYQAAFNNQNGLFVSVPRIVFNFLKLSHYFLH